MEYITILLAIVIPAAILIPHFRKALRPAAPGNSCGSCTGCPASKACGEVQRDLR